MRSNGGERTNKVCYYEGKGVPKNLAAARGWFQKAAEQDGATAMEALGTM